MKYEWLHRHQRQHLILFCNGWGMDANPFRPLAATESDVLVLSDYHDLIQEPGHSCPDPDPANLLGPYPRISLIAWSMGVWAGQQLFGNRRLCLHETIAINGTLCPIDDRFGIPPQIYDGTLNQFNEAGRLKFYRRMCHDRNTLPTFLEHQPERSLASQHRELEALRNRVFCQAAEGSIYTRIIVTSRDLVIPTANQLSFWQGQNVLNMEGAHFPFYRWHSWEALLEELR